MGMTMLWSEFALGYSLKMLLFRESPPKLRRPKFKVKLNSNYILLSGESAIFGGKLSFCEKYAVFRALIPIF